MFPAQKIIRLDENKMIENIDKVPDESAQAVIDGIRISGLLKQTQCLLTYALDMFHDLTDVADKISQKVASIEERANAVSSSISKYNNISDFWEENQENMVSKFTPSDYKQFSFTKSRIVQNMISNTNKPPDLTKFNKIEKEIEDKEGIQAQSIDFNNFFSDPQYFQNQYMNELAIQLNKEKEARKQAIKQQRQKEKEKKRKRQQLKKMIQEKQDQKDESIKLAICQPPPAPSGLRMPPPKGQAIHESASHIQSKSNDQNQFKTNNIQNRSKATQEYAPDHNDDQNEADSSMIKIPFQRQSSIHTSTTNDFNEDETNTTAMHPLPDPNANKNKSSNDLSDSLHINIPQINPNNPNQFSANTSSSHDNNNDILINTNTNLPNQTDNPNNFTNDSQIQNLPPPPSPPPPPPPPPANFLNPPATDAKNKHSNPPNKASQNSDDNQVNFLDLIKNHKFVLKPVDRSKPLEPPPKPKEPVDQNVLTIQELLMQIAIIREKTAASDSSESDEESESTDPSW